MRESEDRYGYCDLHLESKLGDPGRCLRVKPLSFGQEEPFTRIIQRKAQAKYETGGHPVDLVLHFDQQPPDRAALQNHLRRHAAALDELTTRGPFSRVWIYDGWSKSVLWRSAD